MQPYDCEKCPAYCCGYPVIEATKTDIRRLARRFGMEPGAAREKFTERENNRVRKMRQQYDKKLGAPVCIFLDQKTRNCSVYEARPQICRDHPGDRCEWHDRRLLENAGGKKVIRLKVMPWDIDADYPFYTERKTPALLEEYAGKTAAAKREFARNILSALQKTPPTQPQKPRRKGKP